MIERRIGLSMRDHLAGRVRSDFAEPTAIALIVGFRRPHTEAKPPMCDDGRRLPHFRLLALPSTTLPSALLYGSSTYRIFGGRSSGPTKMQISHVMSYGTFNKLPTDALHPRCLNATYLMNDIVTALIRADFVNNAIVRKKCRCCVFANDGVSAYESNYDFGSRDVHWHWGWCCTGRG